MELCFTVAPDVSSVDLEAENLKAEGLGEYLETVGQTHECDSRQARVHFVRGEKNEQSLNVQYEIQMPKNGNCEGGIGQIDLSLHQS